ncbi:formyltetrahydrofolate-dependent phosphoribosylglycinamide formyltransferase [Desulfuromonas soudanensis]|uniref:Phosphoribosylglycinamide formyltransferase n=1 Tax=Desulfuromonas soudanensis TaxID=1603606 RepID=A0A0M4D2F1_9BACT|nr:phosphoribosylglycinamide formyltransferase [Desulfuromonas soudanensis]ALC16476.1 formyltetrahydrofolate-dependent phosphoribosylglycinamide formyltransferase [Desulfuromonas soudanensis]
MTERLRLGCLASGGGSNLQAIIDRCRDGSLAAEISVVISNKPDSGALQRARNAGIPALCIDHRNFPTREDFDRAVVAALLEAGVELIVLAGFMRLISDVFLDAFPGRIMNIHPALLPAFPGLHVQRKALEYGARVTGATVHFVDGGVDTGPIVIQAVVPILDDDTEESLSARILEQEHRIYPRAIELFAQGRLRIDGRRVRIEPPLPPGSEVLVHPPL